MTNESAQAENRAIANMSRYINVGLITAIRSGLDQQVAAIAADKYMSREGKDMKIAEALVNSRMQMDALRTELETKVAADRHRIERTAFGPSSFDPADRLATRDAFDRASRLASSEEANQVIEQAKLTGDEGLARAVMHRAHRQGWSSTVDVWEGHQPGTKALLGELEQLPEDNFTKNIVFTVKKPNELSSTNEYMINRYAAHAKRATREDLHKDEVPMEPTTTLTDVVVAGELPLGE